MKSEAEIRALLESALENKDKGGSVVASAATLLWVLDEDSDNEQLQQLISYLNVILQQTIIYNKPSISPKPLQEPYNPESDKGFNFKS